MTIATPASAYCPPHLCKRQDSAAAVTCWVDVDTGRAACIQNHVKHAHMAGVV